MRIGVSRSTHESVDAEQDEIDRDDDGPVDVDDGSRHWVVVDEQVGEQTFLVRRVTKQVVRYTQQTPPVGATVGKGKARGPSIARDDLSTLPGDDPFPRARMHREQCAVNWDLNLKPKLAIMRQCTSVTDRRTDRRTLTS